MGVWVLRRTCHRPRNAAPRNRRAPAELRLPGAQPGIFDSHELCTHFPSIFERKSLSRSTVHKINLITSRLTHKLNLTVRVHTLFETDIPPPNQPRPWIRWKSAACCNFSFRAHVDCEFLNEVGSRQIKHWIPTVCEFRSFQKPQTPTFGTSRLDLDELSEHGSRAFQKTFKVVQICRKDED